MKLIYLPVTRQRRWVEAKLYWTKDASPDGNSNPLEEMGNKVNVKLL